MAEKDDGVTLQVSDAESHSVDKHYGNFAIKRWGLWVSKTLEVQDSEGMTVKDMFLYNHDLKPVEEARRTWQWWDFVTFWIADAMNLNSLQIASTGLVNGLNWWQTWLSVWLGYFFVGVFVSSTSRIGGSYHVPFPVSCRGSFGTFGSIWPILNRVVMAVIWFSVQTWIMGQCMQLMLRSIFGNDLDTRLGTQNLSGTTSFQFLSFFLAWLLQLPFLWFEPQILKHVFLAKAVVAPASGVAYLIWTLIKSHGIPKGVNDTSTVTGSAFGWAFIDSTMNCIANFATLVLNSGDFSRFAKTKRASWLPHLFIIPTAFSLTCLVGILATSAAEPMYQKWYWSPLDILSRFLDNYTSGNRAGVFFVSGGFLYAQIGTNLAANSISCGTDMTAMLPRYITIRRGSYICAALALCLVPWNFFSSSSTFTTYLSAYAIFLSSIAGVMVCDYYWVRRGYFDLYALYDGKRGAPYSFTTIGVNWRAYAAYICGVVPVLPGFIKTAGVDSVPVGAQYIYRLNFFVGFIISFLLYAVLSYFWPVQGMVPQMVDKPFQKGWYEVYAEVEDFEEVLFEKRYTVHHPHTHFHDHQELDKSSDLN